MLVGLGRESWMTGEEVWGELTACLQINRQEDLGDRNGAHFPERLLASG
jgi:hypothetical protein